MTSTDSTSGPHLGVLTSGGDAPGMNAGLRAVVRTALRLGATPYAVMEGWQGAVDGGAMIRPLAWDDVGGVLHLGGTVIGTARAPAFQTRDGMLAAAEHLLEHGIDRLVVIGGDGSLAGLHEFRQAWPGLLEELEAAGRLEPATRAAHPHLSVVGMVGSIDNDMVGTDMTIGADTALHRIVEALDAIASTAASHQRTFVVEVMGRHCGYLALMAAVAGGCDYVLIPESPPGDGWEQEMVATLRRGRRAGRRESLVIVAEGARDRNGNAITSAQVKASIREHMGEGARVTILGHVQRGGAPSAYDRWMPTLLGYAAAQLVLSAAPDDPPQVLGVRHNRLSAQPLVESVAATRAVKGLLEERRYAEAAAARGSSFVALERLFSRLATPPGTEIGHEVLVSSRADHPDRGEFTDQEAAPPRVAVLHAGGLAPGMNTAARAVARLLMHRGMVVLGAQGSLAGLAGGDVRELDWGEIDAWVDQGGAALGTRRGVPGPEELAAIAATVEREGIDGLVLIGGLDAYLSAQLLVAARQEHPVLSVPLLCLPATIDNNVPGTELAIGADTALNVLVQSLTMIRQSASASKRCFVAETKGGRCGYLASMSGLAAGAEKVYLHEDGMTLAEITRTTESMVRSFQEGRGLYLVIRNEEASEAYTTDFLARVFEEEGGTLFDVRANVLGHVQEGADPSPFDRLLATRLAACAVDDLAEQVRRGTSEARCAGLTVAGTGTAPLEDLVAGLDLEHGRPREQWWRELGPVRTVVTDRHGTGPVDPLRVIRPGDLSR